MRHHLIVGALTCFGSSLFGQAPDNTANQVQGTLDNVQSTAQDGLGKAQDPVNNNVPQNLGTANLGDVQNRPLLNGQNQVNRGTDSQGAAGVQSNTNLQSGLDRQPGQLNSNFSTQVQGQSTSDGQQRNGTLQNSTNQYGSSNQRNATGGIQSSGIQRQGQVMEPGQFSNQVGNAGVIQNNGVMQNRSTTPMRNQSQWNQSQNNNMQQSRLSQASGRVYMLRYDANGREFICIGGRPVYFDNVSSVSAPQNSATQNQYRAGYGNYDLNNGPNSQNQSGNGSQTTNDPRASGTGQSSSGNSNNSQPGITADSGITANGSAAATPNGDRSSSNNKNETTERQTDGSPQSTLDIKPDIVNPNEPLSGVIDPKS